MKRWYIFLLQDSFRTRDIKAHTVYQAYRIAQKEYGNKVLDQYQTCPLSGTTFSGWKDYDYRPKSFKDTNIGWFLSL